MEKEVKIRLPKGIRAEMLSTNIKDDNIVVKYKLNKVFTPKHGDIIFIKCSDSSFIWIFDNYKDDGIGNKCVWCSYYILLNHPLYVNKSAYLHQSSIKEIRIANIYERNMLFSALKEIGLVWNEETKSIEKYRWRAHGDETYWYVDECGIVQEKADCYFQSDDGLFNLGNYFDTEEKAKEYADKIKELFKSNA